MKKLFFSIIVPVYNTSKYIPRCLDSIINQEFDSSGYEIIVIDDGSTDNSFSILETYSSQFATVKIIKKINEGVSVARNLGIEQARGKYILFVDSDDSIGEGALLSFYNSLLLEEVDMLIGRSVVVKNDGKSEEVYPFGDDFLRKEFRGSDLVIRYNYSRGSVCGVAFRSDFLRAMDIRFSVRLKNGEDSMFILFCWIHGQRVKFISILTYLINERLGSASRTFTFERIDYMVNNLEELINVVNSRKWDRSHLSILNFGLYSVISRMFSLFYNCFSIGGYFIIRKRILDRVTKLNTGDINLCRQKVKVFNFSIDIFALLIFLKKFTNR